MSKKELKEVLEQDAIFDGKPKLIPLGALMNLQNWYAEGGTPHDMRQAKGYMKNPKRYRIQLHLYVEELE